MFVDLNRFKYMNDFLGHPIGDKLLKAVSNRLKGCFGKQDVLARLGGDEFATLLTNIRNTDQAMERAKLIVEMMEKPFFIDDFELFVSISVGISLYPYDGADSETLMRHADSALYKAKEKKGNAYQIYSSGMDVETHRTFKLESELRNALNLNQFEYYYQPKVCSQTNQIVGVEALLRWNHPEWGIMSPGEFLPIAEEIGVMREISKQLNRSAFAQNKAWQDAGLPAIPISINLSARRFKEKELLTSIANVLEETKLEPEYLELEITEKTLLENEHVVFSILDELKQMRVRISLDDFGTGYSSLSCLKRFKERIDTLKIDRLFINDLSEKDADDSNFITQSIIQLAQHLNMDVVAEGVETLEQLDILKQYKCNTIQGYLYSKPVPAAEFAELLRIGKIETPAVDHTHEKVVTHNRRRYFRIPFEFPLGASMTLIRLQGRKVELGKTEILIDNMGLGGLRFLTDIKLPVQRDIILEFETELLGEIITLHGEVVWMNELKPEIYAYGLQFLMDESKRPNLTRILNKLSILLRKNPLVPDCRFMKIDRFRYFKNKELK